MSLNKTIDTQTLATLNRALIGFDNIVNARLLASFSNYPPYNIIKYDDTHYALEIAVSGFKKSEISIEIKEEHLTISGQRDILDSAFNAPDCSLIHCDNQQSLNFQDDL